MISSFLSFRFHSHSLLMIFWKNLQINTLTRTRSLMILISTLNHSPKINKSNLIACPNTFHSNPKIIHNLSIILPSKWEPIKWIPPKKPNIKLKNTIDWKLCRYFVRMKYKIWYMWVWKMLTNFLILLTSRVLAFRLVYPRLAVGFLLLGHR